MNAVPRQDRWTTRLLAAACEKISNWILSHELNASPHNRQMLLSCNSFNWEEAYALSMGQIKQISDEEV